ncbi:MAG: hypothetical protein LBN39_09835 [Planctomycetaceae bacterium]|jgi:hypothetical protein|nr:hypothetical protein [Planctomycetaceae bacterium]
MNFNFFDWIRDGVKRAILLGTSDAVEVMGMPHEEETAKDKILSFLRDDSVASAAPPRNRIAGSVSTGQRKLGKSITEIHALKEA